MRKIVIKLECFKVAIIDRIEKFVPILFKNDKTSIQLGKSTSNIKKIKCINITFYEVKDKSKKNIMSL